jgi:hypothetical protein
MAVWIGLDTNLENLKWFPNPPILTIPLMHHIQCATKTSRYHEVHMGFDGLRHHRA